MSDGQDALPRPDLRELLKHLADRGGIHGYISTSSVEIGEELDVAQQTASRWIRQLEDGGHLERRLGSRGQQLRLTDRGVAVLVEELNQLEAILGNGDLARITGTVSPGDGEGAYYMSQPFYERGFEALLGFTPYPGTLNLSVEGDDLDTVRVLRNRSALEIAEVKTPERTFGGVTSYPAEVEGLQAGVIFPHRTRHERVLEVIAPVRLREALELEDGAELTVLVDARPGQRTVDPSEEGGESR